MLCTLLTGAQQQTERPGRVDRRTALPLSPWWQTLRGEAGALRDMPSPPQPCRAQSGQGWDTESWRVWRARENSQRPVKGPQVPPSLVTQCLPSVLEVHQFAQEAVVADAWLTAQEPLLQSRELGSSVDEVEQLIRRHEAFRKAAAAWEERFSSLRRLTTVSTPDPAPATPTPIPPDVRQTQPALCCVRAETDPYWSPRLVG